MSRGPTETQIRAQVKEVLDKPRSSNVIGIRAPIGAVTGESLQLGGREISLARCESVLAARAALTNIPDDSQVVLLTPLSDAELGADLLARFVNQKLYAIQPWLLVRGRFKARHVDSRLVQRYPWAAELLLEVEPATGYAPVPSGFLEADGVWQVLFETLLGMPRGARDAQAVLEWSANETTRQRAFQIKPEILSGLSEAIEDGGGMLARRMFDFAIGSEGHLAVAVGLVARVVYGDAARADENTSKAAGRLEAKLGDTELSDSLALAWAEAAEALVRRRLNTGDMKGTNQILSQADSLLGTLNARDFAHKSDAMLLGFEQRLERFGQALQRFAKGKTKRVPQPLVSAATQVDSHLLGTVEPHHDKAAQVRMAMRLARWLAMQREAGETSAGSLVAAATEYRRHGGFVDWARGQIWDGDRRNELGAGYKELWGQLRHLRERQNARFGELLANWTALGSSDTGIIPVEDALERVVSPLAKEQPVLLVVVDGMSMAVFREVETDLSNQGWIQVDRVKQTIRVPVIAALPTVTQVSRASLLAGKLTVGPSAAEKKSLCGPSEPR